MPSCCGASWNAPTRACCGSASWGGANTLAQALHGLQRTRPKEAVDAVVSRLRIYAISDQDDSGAWLRREFPGLFYIISPGSYANPTWSAIHREIEGIDNQHVSNAWIARHIQQGHGPLGAAYPDVAYGMEGDAPSFPRPHPQRPERARASQPGSFLWFAYPEAGTLKTRLSLGTENVARVGLRLPDVEAAATAHVIVQVTDKGTPALTRYQRVILHIEPRAR